MLPAISGRVFIASFVTAAGVQIGITSASFGLRFSIRDGIAKKIKTIRKKKNKHNKTD